MMNKAFDKYMCWILKEELNVRPRTKHKKLWRVLFETPFEIVILMDKNRRGDGDCLRERFLREYPEFAKYFDGIPCSVLEMLAAFAIRVDGEWIGDPGDPRPDKLFVEFLDNLGLMSLNDKNWDEQFARMVLDRWMQRDFEYDGKGSIFPIMNPVEDQRKKELWRQMTEYVNENYA